MFPENISENFDRVREIAFSDLPMEEKMILFDSFDEIEVFCKNVAKTVKNCFFPIEGFEDYAVNPFGDVISNKGDFVKLLSKCTDSSGYIMVNLHISGKHYNKKVHKLVADAFLQKVEGKPQVNHIDGDKMNNRLDNLEYCTAKENTQHAHRTGLCSKRGRLTEDELDQIVDMLNAGVIYREIADRFNIGENQVLQIAIGRTHKELYGKIDIPKKIPNTYKTKIRCIETGKLYNSQKEAALDLNINGGNIPAHLQGKRSHVNGFHFLRIDEEEN